jgi:monomeric sarcosine oxidase
MTLLMTLVDIAVVGAGLAGAATAWAATRRGLSVVLLEQFDIGHGRGSSHGSARIFRRTYPDALYVGLTGAAGDLWREVEADAGIRLLVTTGGLDHGARRPVALMAGLLADAGVPHEVLDALEARRRWPGIRFETPVLFHPEAGVIDAGAAVDAFVMLARRRGATVLDRTPVTAIDPREDRAVVRTETGSVAARRVVVAAGPWVAGVVPAGVPFPPVVVSQQQIFHFPRRDEAIQWPLIVHKDALSTYALPGGRDGGPAHGQKVAEHAGGRSTTAAGRDGVVDPAARARIVDYVRGWLPGLVPEPFHETTCLYTSTADEDFVLDRRGPVVVCSACSGLGAKFAPWIGMEATRLAAGGEPQPRFRLARPGLVPA